MLKVLVLLVACLPALAQKAPAPPPAPEGAGGLGMRGGGARRGMQQPQQSPQQPAGPPGSVRGQVVTTSGDPLRKAEVTLRSTTGGQGTFGATTDAAGVFFLDGVLPGNYVLMAQRNGYVRQDAAIRSVARSGPPTLVVGPGQAVTGVTVKLIPHAVVTGKVVDEDGDPVARVMVQVQRERWQRGQRQFLPVSNGTTNDLGEYRVASLPPGKYYVSANAQRQFEGDPRSRVRPGGGAPETGYITTFYPNVIDRAQAAPLEVAAGQEARGIDFQIRKVVTHRIRGRIVDAAGGSLQNVSVMAMSRDSASGAAMRAGGAVRNQDGTFELSGIPPGDYTLIVNRMTRDQGRASATHDIQLGNRDLDGVVVTLAPPVPVTGAVRGEADARLDLSRVRVSLEPAAGMPMLGGNNQAVSPDSTFKMPGLSTGKYRVAVYNLPEGTYLKSVKQGPQEVLDSGLQITSAGAPLELVLGSNAPGLTGIVNDSNGKPVPGLAVALVPDAPRRDQYHLYSTTTTGDTGSFTFRSITPGNYKVFVLAASNVEDVQNPAFLAQNESRGTSVKLVEGKTENLQLTF